MPPSTQRILVTAIVVALVLLRQWLTAKDEILLMDGDPVNYARMSVEYLSGTASDNLPTQRPGISLLAMYSSELGVPYKLLLDLMFLVAVGTSAWLTRRQTGSTLLALVVLAVLLFNPWFMLGSQTLMGEPVVAIGFLLLATGSWAYLDRPPAQWSWTTSLWCAATAGGIVLVRPENVLIYAFTGLLIIVTGILWFRQFIQRPWGGVFVSGLLLAAPALAAWGTVQIGSQVHLRHYGVATMSASEMPGLHALMNALYSVQPTEAVIRYVPVTKQTLAAVCDESPVMGELAGDLLDEKLPNYRHCREALGIEGQVGPWLNWHLLQCFGGPPAKANAIMQRAAEEIHLIQAMNRLPRRWGRFPVDPDVDSWSRDVLPTFRTAMIAAVSPENQMLLAHGRHRQRDVSALSESYFDVGTMRRHGSRAESMLIVSGFTDDDKCDHRRVRAVGPEGNPLGQARIVPGRSHPFQFNLEIDLDQAEAPDLIQLEFLGTNEGPWVRETEKLEVDGRYKSYDVPSVTGRKVVFLDSGFELASSLWQTQAILVTQRGNWRETAQVMLDEYYPWLLAVATGLAFLSGLFSTAGPDWAGRPLAAFLVIAWGFVICRGLFYTLIEVWLYWGLERYVAPQSVLSAWLLVVSAAWLGKLIRSWFGRQSSHQQSNPLSAAV